MRTWITVVKEIPETGGSAAIKVGTRGWLAAPNSYEAKQCKERFGKKRTAVRFFLSSLGYEVHGTDFQYDTTCRFILNKEFVK